MIHRTLNSEHVFPDMTPKVELNWITSGDISPRQLEMLRLYIRGMSYSEIARENKMLYLRGEMEFSGNDRQGRIQL